MKHLRDMLFATVLFLGLAMVPAHAGEYIEGKHYQKAPNDIVSNQEVQDFLKQANGKVQVLEFFSYGCSWCFKLDPYVEKWYKGTSKNVDFQRVPVEFHPTWATLSRAYYTEVDLNVVDKVHSALFDAIQTERISNTSEESLKQFFMNLGIPEKDFTKTFASNNVTDKQKWANNIARAYKITSVPAVIVQGPKGIFITAVRMAGSEENVIKVVDELVDMQNKALKSSQNVSKKAASNKQ